MAFFPREIENISGRWNEFTSLQKTEISALTFRPAEWKLEADIVE
jgi:hypothetical protein